MTVLEGDASVLCVHSNDCHGIVGEVTMVCDADGMSSGLPARPCARPHHVQVQPSLKEAARTTCQPIPPWKMATGL